MKVRITQWLDAPVWIEAKWVESIQIHCLRNNRLMPSYHRILRQIITKWPRKTQRSYEQRLAHSKARWPMLAKTLSKPPSMHVTSITTISSWAKSNANKWTTIAIIKAVRVKKRTLLFITISSNMKITIWAQRRFLSKAQAFSLLTMEMEFIMSLGIAHSSTICLIALWRVRFQKRGKNVD